ncbi:MULTISPECIES: TonB-dependent receptor [Tenacibaculum]|uniref:TonB-dependent receptor n=1 Tax=Tenacibaculum TaxID=104267 RepID=UPI001F0B1169|nr:MULTISPECIES: TonB-dependent receptor [Tenacibaculum]MCH3880794.1 TonB-dependent receptor [Tenacibaculum aquimarinum]MDO6599607.1 TonB-dependent receptor [Tenacibaculum sp. 1_MG-2023]
MKKVVLLIILIVFSLTSFAQEIGVVKGSVINKQTREVLPFVNVIIEGSQKGTITDENGSFELKNVTLGYVKIRASFVGFSTVVSEDYLVTQDKTPFIVIALEEDNSQLDEVIIQSSLFKRKVESPLSLQNLGVAEIEKNPGGNRDVLKVIQSLPGVASNPGFRNDIIIRGGATSENKFYVDGIEVPVINHFQTQGASGGPVGIINTDLIRKVDFYSSAFPANRGNTLSSVIEFTQKTGNLNSFEGRATLGTSDAGITLQGPLSKNTSVMFSARQSYLQFLFKLIKLPFLPTYNDFQLNVKSKLDNNDEIAVFALAAIDDFELNEEVNDGVTDEETLKKNNYSLSRIPIQTQWNYTFGASYKHYAENSTQTYVLSRNEWKNNAVKYFDNTNNPNDLLLDYSSKEIENKFRFENDMRLNNGIKLNFGVSLQQAKYQNKTFQRFANTNGLQTFNFDSEFSVFSYAVFAQASQGFFNENLQVSVGVRADANNYNSEMKNPFNQFSPRVSASYSLSDKWFVNASLGKYYQLPAYTVLGYRDNNNVLVNQPTTSYISSAHTVAGLEFRPENNSKITLEGFYKSYDKYPFSIKDQVSLANLGNDFGVVGSEAVISNNQGRSYGFELLAQKKSFDGIYGILSYTFVRSEFKDVNNTYVPSTWDNKHLLTFTGGKKLNRNWEIGAKFRLVGGRPYTPYDFEKSAIIENYDANNQGVLDFSKLNTERFDTFTQLDLRIDKTWYWKKTSLNFYIDIQNALGSESVQQAFLVPVLDANGNKVVDPNDSSKYVLEEVENSQGNLLPGFGFIVDF